MNTATKDTHQKSRKQENQGQITKRLDAKLRKARNDLVGSKMADKRFYLKHKSYFHHNDRCCAKLLLDKTQYIKKFQIFWKELAKNLLDLQQETGWK